MLTGSDEATAACQASDRKCALIFITKSEIITNIKANISPTLLFSSPVTNELKRNEQ